MPFKPFLVSTLHTAVLEYEFIKEARKNKVGCKLPSAAAAVAFSGAVAVVWTCQGVATHSLPASGHCCCACASVAAVGAVHVCSSCRAPAADRSHCTCVQGLRRDLALHASTAAVGTAAFFLEDVGELDLDSHLDCTSTNWLFVGSMYSRRPSGGSKP